MTLTTSSASTATYRRLLRDNSGRRRAYPLRSRAGGNPNSFVFRPPETLLGRSPNFRERPCSPSCRVGVVSETQGFRCRGLLHPRLGLNARRLRGRLAQDAKGYPRPAYR